MAFPNLVLKGDDASLHSEAQGVPVDGDNEFEIGIDPVKINGHEDRLEFNVFALGASVTDASIVSLSADKTKVTVNFVQGGTDQAKVSAELHHSSGW